MKAPKRTGPRQGTIIIRLTPAEKDKIEKIAREDCLQTAVWLRVLALRTIDSRRRAKRQAAAEGT